MTHTRDFEYLLDDDDVQAVEYDADGDVVRVGVREKRPESELADAELITNRVSHPHTDVFSLGDLAFETPSQSSGGGVDRRETGRAHEDRHYRHRPVPAGVSEMHADGGAGTGGPLAVVDDTTAGRGIWMSGSDRDLVGEPVRISNHHVYGRAGAADLGDEILQPSALDGGAGDDSVGDFAGYVPFRSAGESNRVDAAARTLGNGRGAEAIRPHEMPVLFGSSVKRGDYQALRGKKVTKSGRTTGVTTGEIKATGATVKVRYSQDRVIRFRDQLIASNMSRGGDSGSPVYAKYSGALVGLLFAGSDRATICNPIGAVEDELGVRMLTTGDDSDGGDGSGGTGDGDGDGNGDGDGGGDTGNGDGGGGDGSPPGGPDGPGAPGTGRRIARGRTENLRVGGPFGVIDMDAPANSHIAERDYHEAVEEWLAEHFDHVEHEYYFDARRYADFIVRLVPDTPDTEFDESLWFAIEVENDFSSVTESVGQAAMYAGLLEIEEGKQNVTPISILPQDGVEEPELSAIRRHATVVMFPTERE